MQTCSVKSTAVRLTRGFFTTKYVFPAIQNFKQSTLHISINFCAQAVIVLLFCSTCLSSDAINFANSFGPCPNFFFICFRHSKLLASYRRFQLSGIDTYVFRAHAFWAASFSLIIVWRLFSRLLSSSYCLFRVAAKSCSNASLSFGANLTFSSFNRKLRIGSWYASRIPSCSGATISSAARLAASYCWRKLFPFLSFSFCHPRCKKSAARKLCLPLCLISTNLFSKAICFLPCSACSLRNLTAVSSSALAFCKAS